MQIALAQISTVKGEIAANIDTHLSMIRQAIGLGADAIFFPELSITGYEPDLADKLATTNDDARFDDFQALSDQFGITSGVGVPIRSASGVHISMVIFRPNLPPLTYHKRYLHADEEPFFVSGANFPVLELGDKKIGLAICYEISIPAHAQAAVAAGADLYLASVAKHERGIAAAHARLSEIAKTYGIPALLVNNVGPCDNFVGAGGSGYWTNEGIKPNEDIFDGIVPPEMNRLIVQVI